jgi:hypothetical protein
MASGAKKKTTMAKLNRERNVRERRFEKQAKKDARKRAAALGLPSDVHPDEEGQLDELTVEELDSVAAGEPSQTNPV